MPIVPGEELFQTQGVDATENISVLVTKDQKQWLRKASRTTKRSMSELVRQGIELLRKESTGG